MSPFARAALLGFAVAAALAFATWLASLKQRDVSLVDRMWSLMIAAPILAYAWVLPPWTLRTAAMAVLLAVWAIRLALYVSWRNWGHGEDRRYQAIRARNGPNFPVTSLVYIFLLQAVLAWLVSTPLLAAFAYPREWSLWIDCTGATLVVIGIAFEAVGDQQLASFKADAANQGKVMDRGVWRYTRHPNYFGEFCVWWGFFVMVLPLGWWSVISPVVMSVLLLKVSGVSLLEKDIGERRPAYRDYIARTNAFFPDPYGAPPMNKRHLRPVATAVAVGATAAVLVACHSMATSKERPPLALAPAVDLARFMGDWYVIAAIPTVFEKGVYSPMDSYRLDADGTVDTTFSYRSGSFDGERKTIGSRGFVLGAGNAVWGQQYVWPIKADYRIAYVSEDYRLTVVGRDKRDYVWIMSRTPTIAEAELQRLMTFVGEQGYDVAKLERMPQRPA